MITKGYIQESGSGKMEPEHRDVKAVLESRGVICKLFTSKRVQRNQLVIDPETIVVGDNPTMLQVFKKLGIDLVNDSYPKSIRNYLERTIRETTIRKLLIDYATSERIDLFIKPKSKAKLFTGFVLYSGQDLFKLHGLSKETELYCSPAVEWLSEFRVFVLNDKIVGIKHYSGDPEMKLDLEIVKNAISDLRNSPQRTAAYGIDFGILKNGKTALVEWNDGFALGSYGLEKELYTDLIVTRWEEVVSGLDNNREIDREI